MATDFKWKTPESIVTVFTTGLDSLANSTSITTGKALAASAVDNLTDLYEFMQFEFVGTYGSTPTTGAYIGLWLIQSLDDTNYEDGSTTIDPSRSEDMSIPLLLTTSAQRVVSRPMLIPPFKFKPLLKNKAGQAMASSGNTLKLRRWIENAP